MFLTPKDIHDKTFKRSFKGYDENEVDEFLDLVIKEFNLMIDENERLRQELMAKPIVQDYSATSVGEIKRLEEMLAQAIEAMNNNSQILSNVSLNNREADKEPKEEQQALGKNNKLDEFKKALENYKSNFELLIEEQKKQLNEKYSEIIGELSTISGQDGTLHTAQQTETPVVPTASAAGSSQVLPQIQSPEKPTIFNIPPAEPTGMIEKQKQPETIVRQPEISYQQNKEIERPQLSETPKYQGIVNQSADEQNTVTADNRFKPNYSEYAWLYQDKDVLNKNNTETANLDITFRNPKEKEELKRLIDEVID